MVLHLSNDLFLVGKVSSWAKSNNVAYKSVSSVEKFRTALQGGDVSRVVVDLQIKQLDIAELAREIREFDTGQITSGEIVLSGYAQHVMTELIDAAEQAGYDSVLTRGQFDRKFASVITG